MPELTRTAPAKGRPQETTPDRLRVARRHLDDLSELPGPPTGGRPLPPDLLRTAGGERRVDLTAIRLHHDWFAQGLTDALDAQAVTDGHRIYLAADAPDPATRAGRMLLAHELFHAVHGGTSSAPAEEEARAERSGLLAARSGEPDASTTSAPDPPTATAGPSGHDGAAPGEVSASEPGAASGSGRRGVAGRLGRLGRRARATLVPAGSDSAALPDVVSAGEALVRLVGRLFDRDPDDHGGRITSVLARLEPRLREDVVTEVASRSGTHVGVRLQDLALERPPEDGGHTTEEIPVAGSGTSGELQAEGTTADEEATAVGKAPAGTKNAGDGGTAAAQDHVRDTDAAGTGAQGASETAPSQAKTGPANAPATAPELPDQDGVDEQPPAASALRSAPAPRPAAGSGPAAPASAPTRPTSVQAPQIPAGGGAPASAEAAAGDGAAGMDVGPVGGDGDAERADPVAEAPVDGGPTAGAEDAEPAGGAEPADTAETVGPADTAEPARPTESAEQADTAEPARPTESAGTADTAEPAGPELPELTGTTEPAEPVRPSESTVPGETAVPAEPEQAFSSAPAAAPPDAPEPLASPTVPETEVVGPASDDVDEGPAEAVDREPVTAETGVDSPGEAVTPASANDPATIAALAGIPPSAPDATAELTNPRVPSGGGGGGTAIPDPPEAQAPDVSALSPQAALGAVAGLPATKLAGSLGAVSAAAGREIAADNANLVTNPPSMQRPSGVPADRDASLPPAPLPPLPRHQEKALSGIPGGPGAEPPSPVQPPPAPAPVTLRVPEATTGADQQISAEDAKRIQTAVRSLPTTDPALDVDAGPVPQLELTGGEDPQQVADKAATVDETTRGLQSEGLADARVDMGENDVFPHVPKEMLTAEIGPAPTGPGAPAGPGAPSPPAPGGASPAGGPAAAGGPPPAGSSKDSPSKGSPSKPGGPPAGGGPGHGGGDRVPPAAIDAIAAEQSGGQIAGSARDQSGALGAARRDHDSSAEQARADTDKQINDEIAANGGEQTTVRREIRSSVGRQRKDWVGEQDRIAEQSRTAADAATDRADTAIGDARATARTDARTAIDKGNATIANERSKAERSARKEREKAQRESDSGGFFSWLGSKIKSFVNKIKSAIHAVFELARKVVDEAISLAQKVAVAAIELGRKAVVAAIDVAGKALVAAGDIALAAFPEARKKFRATIQQKVNGAKRAVNELADKLKAGVKKLLDALGNLLKGALTVLEKAYTAAIDAVGKVIDSAIKAAKAFVDALLDFAALIADIAANPMQWIKNLGAGLMDGVHNWVWPSLLGAVKNWFKQKVEAIVGVGSMILDVLRKGGITFARIASMAWTAIKESLPGIVIQLLIEKLVAMLIPAAGAISVIIDGIKAAWGAASKILAAFAKFIAFLKAVKSGRSGPLFGDLVGAAAVAVMDFLANFVLSKLKGAGQKVGGTLRKMAERIMKALKKVAGAVKAGAQAAIGAVTRAGKAVVGAAKRGATAAARSVTRTARAAARAVGRAIPKGALRSGARALRGVRDTATRGYRRAKGAYTRVKQKLLGTKPPPKRKESPQQRLDRVVARIRPGLHRLFRRGVGRIRLAARLKVLQWRYRLSALRAERSAGGVTVVAVVNPDKPVDKAISPQDRLVTDLVREEGERFVQATWVGGIETRQGRDQSLGEQLLGRSRDVSFPDYNLPFGSTIGYSLSGHAVREQRGAGVEFTTRTNYLVSEIGTYPEIAASMRTWGLSDARVAKDLGTYLTSGTLPDLPPEHQRAFVTMAYLITARETARNPGNAAHLAMMNELVARGRSDYRAMLSDPGRNDPLATHLEATGKKPRAAVVRSGGAFPMSMEGAQQASRDIVAGKNTVGSRELLRREIDLIKNWLDATGFTFIDDPEGHEALRRHVRALLKRSFAATPAMSEVG